MSQFEVLRKIGLNKTAIRCYASLLKNGPATAVQLGNRLHRPRTNLYSVLEKLVVQGFVMKFDMTTQPALFIARPINEALPHHYMYQRHLLLPLCQELGIWPPAMPPKWLQPGKFVA